MATFADKLRAFQLERFFAIHEFTAQHLLCVSDVEPLTMKEVLAIADADSLERWGTLTLGYTESQGLPALREEVAKCAPHQSNCFPGIPQNNNSRPSALTGST